MLLARSEQTDVRLPDPLIDDLNSLLRGKSPSGQSRIRDNTEERSDGLPRQPNGLGRGENGLDPIAGTLVVRRIQIVSVEQDIRIENDHLCEMPSSDSINSATQS